MCTQNDKRGVFSLFAFLFVKAWNWEAKLRMKCWGNVLFGVLFCNVCLALFYFAVHARRRKIVLIKSNAKCRYQKKFTCKGTLRQVFICLRPPPLLGFCSFA